MAMGDIRSGWNRQRAAKVAAMSVLILLGSGLPTEGAPRAHLDDRSATHPQHRVPVSPTLRRPEAAIPQAAVAPEAGVASRLPVVDEASDGPRPQQDVDPGRQREVDPGLQQEVEPARRIVAMRPAEAQGRFERWPARAPRAAAQSVTALAMLDPEGPLCSDATLTWTGQAGDGLWSTAANWSAGRTPGTSDRACLPAGATATITAATGVKSIDIQTEAVLVLSISSTSYVDIYERVANEGTVRVTGVGGLKLLCSSRVVNRGLIQFTASSGGSLTALPAIATIDGLSGCGSSAGGLHNTATGVIESLSANRVFFSNWVAMDNDGLLRPGWPTVVANAYSAAPIVDDAVSSGRFTGVGGIVDLSNVTVGPATQLDNGIEVSGGLRGTGTIPAGVVIDFIDGGSLYAELSGPGWAVMHAGPTLGGYIAANIVGNVRIDAAGGRDIGIASTSTNSPNVTITSTGLLQIATSSANMVTIYGTLTNQGTIQITNQGGFTQRCSSRVVNRGLIQFTASSGGSLTALPAIATIDGLSGCGSSAGGLHNTATGVIESLSANRVFFSNWVAMDNDVFWSPGLADCCGATPTVPPRSLTTRSRPGASPASAGSLTSATSPWDPQPSSTTASRSRVV